METVIGTPISVLVKLPYERLKDAAGSLRGAIDDALASYSDMQAKHWRLGYTWMSILDDRHSWRGPMPHADDDDPYFEVPHCNNGCYASAAYFEDIEELIESTYAVIDERGHWHEPDGDEVSRAEFRRTYFKKFVEGTAPDTVLAVVNCWFQSSEEDIEESE